MRNKSSFHGNKIIHLWEKVAILRKKKIFYIYQVVKLCKKKSLKFKKKTVNL